METYNNRKTWLVLLMSIRDAKGDLLEQRVDAIVNTVNTVGVMGKGIALQFKRKWPANAKAYEIACERREVVPGKMFIFDNGGLVEPKFIINFPTKRHWRQPSRLEDIDAGLIDLVEQIKKLNITSIAIPPLGCGNGGLAWNVVQPRIIAAFKTLPNVEVYLFAPSHSDSVRALAPEIQKPNMTAGRAAVLKVLSVYRQMLYPLSQLEVQKLCYFLWRSGQDLQLKFVKHTYGPYASNLRHVLTKMDGAYINGVGDGTRSSEITVLENALNAAEAFLSSSEDTSTAKRVDRVANLIEGFETPYGMELLATVHWAATEEPTTKDFEEIKRRVHTWSDRKKQIMKSEDLRIAYDRLSEDGWLN